MRMVMVVVMVMMMVIALSHTVGATVRVSEMKPTLFKSIHMKFCVFCHINQ